MFEIDKEQFGALVSQLRKDKGLTQKEVAQQLFISDKAVSKWERGLSVPDIALLIPLADLLDVTVTELLQCKRQEQEALLDEQQVEALVKTTIQLSEQEKRYREQQKTKRMAVWFGCVCVAALELGVLLFLGYEMETTAVLLPEVLFAVFSYYFYFLVQEQLPAYYDAYSVNAYVDGVFRLNLPGVRFHNGNWPHIVGYCRIWTGAALVGYPLLYLLAEQMAPVVRIWNWLALALILGSIFVPLYAVAKKYE